MTYDQEEQGVNDMTRTVMIALVILIVLTGLLCAAYEVDSVGILTGMCGG